MERQEQVEWTDLNKLLQHHGFKPVQFADPVQNKNLSDLVLLDRRSAAEVRSTLRTMLTDSERRQVLIHELVRSNNQLKQDAQKHMSRAVQQSQRAAKLEGLLDRVKTRVQDLEDRYLSKAGQEYQPQQEKQDARKLCEVLQQKLLKQTEENAQLQRKLYFAVKEEENRLARQSRAIQNICKNVSGHSSAADQQLLDVIDFYETKLTLLLDELRPTLRDGKFYKHKLGHLKLNQPNDTRSDGRTPESDEHIGDPVRDARFCSQYHYLLTEISSVVTGSSAPLQLHRQKPSVGVDLAGFQSLVPTVKMWAQQLNLLKELQRGLDKLAVRLVPWQPADSGASSTEAVKVEDMMVLVDSLLENTCTGDDQTGRSPTPFTLGSMVSHFQKLFDVPSLSGVYPRMNEVYTRLGELTTAMRNLRDVLDLDSRVPPAEVVNTVSSLVSSTKRSAGLRDVLVDSDIDSILVKVKQHEEFFPAFHGLATELLHTLGVCRLGDILPALKSLKQRAQ